MDIAILISIAVGLITVILFLKFWTSRSSGTKQETENQAARAQPVRRAAGVRNARRRMQGRNAEEPAGPARAQDASDEENNADEEKITAPSGKMGAKKRAKLEAKAEKRQAREAMEKERDERKKKDHQLQEEADKQREKERLEELKRDEEEKKEREEKERKEYEEYLKMKQAFSVEEEGFDENERDEENLLQEFIDYIKANKVVILEDLAGHFRLKTAAAIQRIQDLQTSGRLTGVIDDRGKFIHITQEELEAVAAFVNKRGRVSIAELAAHSNQLINLNPTNPAAVDNK